MTLKWPFYFSQDVPLIPFPVVVDSGKVNIEDIKNYEGNGYLEGLGESGGAGGCIDLTTSAVTAENMHLYNQYGYLSGQNEMEFMGGGMMAGQDMSFTHYKGGAFDGMALSDHFLGEYYLTVSIFKCD